MTTPQRKKRWQQYADQFIDSAYPAVNALISPVVDPMIAAAKRGRPPQWMQDAGEATYNFLSGTPDMPMQPQIPQPPMVAQADVPEAPPMRPRRKRMHRKDMMNMMAQR